MTSHYGRGEQPGTDEHTLTHTHSVPFCCDPLLHWETGGSTGRRGLRSKEETKDEEEERDFSVYTEAQPRQQLLPSTVLPNNKPVIGTFSS